MSIARRQLLKAAGGGAGVVLLSQSGHANDSDESRVFVHPRGERIADAVRALEAVGGTVSLEYDNFSFVAGTIPASRRDRLRSDSRIALVEDDERVEATSSVVDDLVDDDLGDLVGGDDERDDDELSCVGHPAQRPAWGWKRVGADDADETGQGVNVAILDTGIETAHCDLDVAGGRNFTGGDLDDYEDRNGHGTHCAGIACALDNDAGVVGVAPEANLYGVKVLADDGAGHHSWIAAGIDWCMSNDIEIISMSFGGNTSTATIDTVIERAYADGHLLVGSAGNRGNTGTGSCTRDNVTYPATHGDVISISAIDRDDTLASYSSVGDEVELTAPGSDIDSTDVTNDYSTRSGTSMACPYVSGVAGLLWERHEESGPGANDEIRRTLRETAEQVLDSCAGGYGLVSATANRSDDLDDGRDGDDSTDERNGGDDSDRNGDSSSGSDGPLDGDEAGSDGGFESIWSAIRNTIEELLDRLTGRSQRKPG